MVACQPLGQAGARAWKQGPPSLDADPQEK